MEHEAEAGRRKRLLILTLVLMIGLPIYLIAAAYIVGAVTAPYVGPDGEVVRPLHWSLETLLYLFLGVIWVFPLKRLALGVGRKLE